MGDRTAAMREVSSKVTSISSIAVPGSICCGCFYPSDQVLGRFCSIPPQNMSVAPGRQAKDRPFHLAGYMAMTWHVGQPY